MNKLLFWLCIILVVTLTFCCASDDDMTPETVIMPDDDFIMVNDETIVAPFTAWNSDDEMIINCIFVNNLELHQAKINFIGYLTGALRAGIVTDVTTDNSLTGALDAPFNTVPRAYVDLDQDGINIGETHTRYNMLPEQFIYTSTDNGRYVSYVESAVFCDEDANCITVSMRLTCN